MSSPTPSSVQRVVATLAYQQTDVPPMALSLALQTARVAGRPVPELLLDPAAFAAAQLQLHARWQHDIALSMRYAACEAEAFGAEIHFFADGPPNVGAPILRGPEGIAQLVPPDPRRSAPLRGTLEVIERMKAGLDGRALVAGVAVGPVSGPVMLLGMERWLELLLMEPDTAERLVAIYRAFALDWARAQLDHGADLVVWFEPLASSTLLPAAAVQRFVVPALRGVCGLGAPVVLHLASAPALSVLEAAVAAGVAVLSIGAGDDPAALCTAAHGRIALVGQLDGVSMPRWTPARTGAAVAEARQRFGAAGGLVLSDVHGEIPYQVDPSTIDALVGAARAPQC